MKPFDSTRWTCLPLALSALLTVACGKSDPPAPAVVIKAPVEATPPPAAPCCTPQTQPAAQVAVAEVPATQPTPAVTGSKASPWIEPDKRFKFSLDFTVTDQAGNRGKLSQYLGKPLAVSFIFTRCSNPQMCPLITTVTGLLQRDLAKAGLAGQVRLLLISYDPAYDTPDRLKQYAADHGIKFDDGLVAMLRPEPNDFPPMIAELGITVAGTPDGQINHVAELILIDRQGRFVRDYSGKIWEPSPVVKDLQKLAAEPNPLSPQAAIVP